MCVEADDQMIPDSKALYRPITAGEKTLWNPKGI
jgi:hypothetical protein